MDTLGVKFERWRRTIFCEVNKHKIIKNQNNTNKLYSSIFKTFYQKEEELYGLLKIFLLKELSSKLKDKQINKLSK